MKKNFCLLVLVIFIFFSACAKPASNNASDVSIRYGQINCDFSGMTPEIAKAYLAIIDDLSAHLGYDEAQTSDGECLHGGFVHDWDGDKIPELCVLLKTSPRESGSWDGTPIYGWYPPTLFLYTYRNGQAVRSAECDLYFATAGREAALAALMAGNGIQYIRRDYNVFTNESTVECYELINGAMQKIEVPGDVAAASQGAETAQAFLDALGSKAQLLLYNNSGEAKIEGGANAQELRAVLAAKA